MKQILSIFFCVALSTPFMGIQYSYQTVNSQLVAKELNNVAVDNSGNVIIAGGLNSFLTFGAYTRSLSKSYLNGSFFLHIHTTNICNQIHVCVFDSIM